MLRLLLMNKLFKLMNFSKLRGPNLEIVYYMAAYVMLKIQEPLLYQLLGKMLTKRRFKNYWINWLLNHLKIPIKSEKIIVQGNTIILVST